MCIACFGNKAKYGDHVLTSECCDTQLSHCVFFLDGPGGTGKTFVYSLLLDTIRSRGDIAIAVASSGLAALLMPGGRTALSRRAFVAVLCCTYSHGPDVIATAFWDWDLHLMLICIQCCSLKTNRAAARVIREAKLTA